MDYRHFELQDLVSEALIAVEARDYAKASATLQKLLTRIESDWLATPSDAHQTPTPAHPPAAADEDEDDN